MRWSEDTETLVFWLTQETHVQNAARESERELVGMHSTL